MERHPGSVVLVPEVDLLIDFRFFIIAMVAVFLSLGLGVVLGSGFIGGAIESQVQGVLDNNQELEREILELEAAQDEDRAFMSALEPVVLEGVLASEQAVIVFIEGTDAALLDGLRNAIEEADGSIASEIQINTRLALDDPDAQQDLTRLLDSSVTEIEELRDMFGSELGDRLGAAVGPGRGRGGGKARSNEILDALVDEGFLSIDAADEVVPDGASFVLAMGSSDKAPWPVQSMVESLGTSLAARGAPLVVAESSESAWRVVSALRQGEAANASLSTVDHADTVQGRIAVALALDEAPEVTEHYGSDEGAAAPVPTPSE